MSKRKSPCERCGDWHPPNFRPAIAECEAWPQWGRSVSQLLNTWPTDRRDLWVRVLEARQSDPVRPVTVRASGEKQRAGRAGSLLS